MPLSLALFRDAAMLAKIRESEKKRFNEKGDELIDRIVQLDVDSRRVMKEADDAKKEKNKVSKIVGQKKRNKENADEEQAKAKELNIQIAELEKQKVEIQEEIAKLLPRVGNLVHESVVCSNDEEKDNEVVNRYGEETNPENIIGHAQLLYRIGGYEPDKGVKVAGHRAYFLTNAAVMLNQALIMYGLRFLQQRGFSPCETPYFVSKSLMAKVAQLSQFDEELYHVNTSDDSGDKYLIATSEQPLCGYFMDEWFREKDLPVKMAGYSTNFRKEAGKSGVDNQGIFRVHQFPKVEQFVVCEPEKSWEMHEEMRQNAEDFLQSLKLPYRVVNIVSGELNLAAAKKYDIEAWFPSTQKYRELVSCSNCLDYQSRAVNCRFGDKEAKAYSHMLNSTLCACTRTISCILEHYQEADGVRVPEVLIPYMGGQTFLPFVREERVDKTVVAQKKAAKKGGK